MVPLLASGAGCVGQLYCYESRARLVTTAARLMCGEGARRVGVWQRGALRRMSSVWHVVGCSASPEQRVSLFRRGFWKKNLAGTVQVTVMCHARKSAPLHSAIVGEQAQLPRVGADAFGQCRLGRRGTAAASSGLGPS